MIIANHLNLKLIATQIIFWMPPTDQILYTIIISPAFRNKCLKDF